MDMLWIGVLMKDFYARELGELARREGNSLAPRWSAAILVYLLIPAGIVLFVRPHLNTDDPWWQATAWGAVFGLVLYGVYDLTNLAVLDKWTVRVTIVDLIWGSVLCGTVATWMHVASRWFGV
jgi:uncharacterized membrane protein